MKTLASVCALVGLASCTSFSGKSGSPPAEFVPVSGNDAILLYSGGCDAWFADAKDQRFKQALELLDARVAELPAELDESSFPAPAIRWFLRMMHHPHDLRIGLTAGDAAEQAPFRGQITVQSGSAEAAQELASSFAEILMSYGVPSLGKNESMHGLSMVPLGEFSAYHGAPDDGSHNMFVIAANTVDTKPAQLGSLDLPAGVTPFFAYKIDYSEIARLSALDQADATTNPMLASMKGSILQGGLGLGADRLYGGVRTRGWRASMEHIGMLPGGPLKKSEIAMIPQDATWATLMRIKLSGLATILREAIAAQPGMGGMDPFEALATFTGFDADKELLQHLGETWGIYASDSTGGGGLLSAVLFQEIKDPAGLEKSFDWIASELTALSETHARGYVRFEKGNSGERVRWLLSFPGLPVPVEAVLELANGYLFAGLSPQAVDAAVRQAMDPESSLLDQPRFRDLAPGSLEDLYSLSYSDTPRLAGDGYALTNLMCAALSNATRSKSDHGRAVGSILPAYPELLQDAKALVALGRIDGDDMVVTIQGDRSMLVNACSLVGQYQELAAVAAIGGAALPKIIEDRKRAEAAKGAPLPGSELPGSELIDPADLDLDPEMDGDDRMEDDDAADEMGEDDVEEAPEPR